MTQIYMASTMIKCLWKDVLISITIQNAASFYPRIDVKGKVFDVENVSHLNYD